MKTRCSLDSVPPLHRTHCWLSAMPHFISFSLACNLFRNRLHAKEKLMKWGIADNQQCVLCSGGTESSEHLVFTCDYSRLIWTKLLSWQGITRPAKTWQAELDWANRNARGKGPADAIFRMSLAAVVYHIWIERNHRIFQAKSTEPHGITRRIVQDIFQRGSLKPKLTSITILTAICF